MIIFVYICCLCSPYVGEYLHKSGFCFCVIFPFQIFFKNSNHQSWYIHYCVFTSEEAFTSACTCLNLYACFYSVHMDVEWLWFSVYSVRLDTFVQSFMFLCYSSQIIKSDWTLDLSNFPFHFLLAQNCLLWFAEKVILGILAYQCSSSETHRHQCLIKSIYIFFCLTVGICSGAKFKWQIPSIYKLTMFDLFICLSATQLTTLVT